MGRFVSVAPELYANDCRLGRHVAGVDEVGRGPLAGSIVAAVVSYDLPSLEGHLDDLAGVRDSKSLSPARRAAVDPAIRRLCRGFAIFEFSAEDIDSHGIQGCNRALVDAAVAWAIETGCEALVVDGTIAPSVPTGSLRMEVRPRADGTSLAVASASILAKQHRDAAMRQSDYLYPGYGFARNSGYGSPEHLAALAELGLTPLHRRSFCSRFLGGDRD